GLIFLGLSAAALTLVLPIIAIVLAGRGAQRVRRLEEEVQNLRWERDSTRRQVAGLEKELTNLRQELRDTAGRRESVSPPSSDHETPAVIRSEPEPLSRAAEPVPPPPLLPVEPVAVAQPPPEIPPPPERRDVPPTPPGPPAGPIIDWERWL